MYDKLNIYNLYPMSYMQVKPANGNAEAAANGDSNGVNGAAPEEEEKNPGAEMLTDEQVSSSITWI